MKEFNELLGENPSETLALASQWCNHQIKQLPESDWLPWASARIIRRNMLKTEGSANIFKYSMEHKKDIPFYARLVADISLLCAKFYAENGGEITFEIQTQIEKEEKDIALQFPEPKAESKVAFVEIDGVTYLKGTENNPSSKFVISKFL